MCGYLKNKISEPTRDKCMKFGKCTCHMVLFNICLDCILSVSQFVWPYLQVVVVEYLKVCFQ